MTNETKHIKVGIKVVNCPEMTAELYPEYAPKTVENFVNLVNSQYYNGKIFHRVIPGFMIQGGCPYGTGTGGTTPIVGEFVANGINNPISHTRGVLSMARTNDPNSGSCQFFICHADSTFLDGQYAAFGIVLDHYEVIDAIANTPRNANDKPLANVQIEYIRVIE